MTKIKAGQNIFFSICSKSFLLGCVCQRVIKIKLSGIIRKIRILKDLFITNFIPYFNQLCQVDKGYY